MHRADLATDLRPQVVTTPEPATARLLAHLGPRLPKGSGEISNGVSKITP